MHVEKFRGGKIRTVDRNRMSLPPQANPPRWRLGTPGNLDANTGSYLQFCHCAKVEEGVPEPVLAKFLLYELSGKVYLVQAVVSEQEEQQFLNPAVETPDIYELKFENGTRRPVVRGLRDLLESNGATLREDRWYIMETRIVEIEGLGHCVVGNFTDAATEPRSRGGGDEQEKAAAADQPTT